jgi:polysaccharide biosynthesis/export protein
MSSFVSKIAVLVLTLGTTVMAQLVPGVHPPGANPSTGNRRNAGATTPGASGAERPDTAVPGINVVQPVRPNEAAAETGNSAASKTPQVNPAMSAASDLVIGPGDLLEVSVYGAADFNALPARVSGDGAILLPMLGSVKVSGLTTQQASELIQKKLGDGGFYNQPQVTVFAREYATQGVSVLGEVKNPGVYPVLGQRKLFDAISQAGGLTARAGNLVKITRRGKQTESFALDSSGSKADENVDIHPGDTVLISKAGIVYVVGDVRMPGGFVMDNGYMTVLQAVAMAQGANGTARLNDSKLIRRAEGQQKEVAIPLKAILASKAPDMTLQPEDIVFVPNSVGKSAARRGLEAVVQAATGVTIYRSRLP